MTALLSPRTWIAIAFAVILSLLGLQTLRISWGQTELAETRQKHAQTLQGISEKANAAYAKSLATVTRWSDAVAAFDKSRLKERDDAITTINALESDVRIGKRKLRFNAACPINRANLSETTTPTRLDHEEAPRPGADVERDYFNLRRALEEVTHQLLALQDYARMTAAP